MPHRQGWAEVADGVHVLRHGAVDVSATVVLGPQGAVVVDTTDSPEGASRIRQHVEHLGRQVVAVVLTHAHYDHTFGLAGLGAGDSRPLAYAHGRFAAHVDAVERPELAAGLRGELLHCPPGAWDDVDLTMPTAPVVASVTIAPGGRPLDLVPLPPAHTTCDVLVHVPDVDLWITGDVVEESGPPCIEADSDLDGWMRALDLLLDRSTATSVLVPGHGAPVGRDFLLAQRGVLAQRALNADGPATRR